MAIAVAFSLMGTFFLVGLYVAGAIGILAIVMMWLYSDAPLVNILGTKAWETHTQIFPLIAVPLFILMGELMLRSGMGERMYGVLSKWLSFLPGGLMHTNIASCAVFAACSGSTAATAATISRVALPSFQQRNYNERLVIGSLAAGGALSGTGMEVAVAFRHINDGTLGNRIEVIGQAIPFWEQSDRL